MDLDAFVSVHGAQWDRLDRLSRRRPRTAAEIDELVALYQRVGAHLSAVRSAGADPMLVSRLSTILGRSRTVLTGAPEPPLRSLARFVTVSFPVAAYRARWLTAASALAFTLIGVALGTWVTLDPRVQATVGTPAEIQQLVTRDFADYYRQAGAGSFAAKVWTNNAWAAALCIALGVTGIGVAWVIVSNGLNVGLVGGLMVAHGRAEEFFGLITPHGLLELTAVFFAAGAGLQLFRSWVIPGPGPRSQAMAAEGRAMVTLALGLVPVLAVSGVIEAFVTPSGLPTWARIGIGVLAWAGFLGYVGWFGTAARRDGEQGDLAEDLAGAGDPVAA